MTGIERRSPDIAYRLMYKKVKNINLRVHPDLSVHVSANRRVSVEFVDSFVQSRAAWIDAARAKISARRPIDTSALPSDAECLRMFGDISAEIFPLFANILSSPPELRVRAMKSRWGVCNIARRQITLNKTLAVQPAGAVRYVVLHEYVHFLHPNHQKGFHDTMKALMPDYKEQRKKLKM